MKNQGDVLDFFQDMYNKIASIILNSGRNSNYAGEVFVSQPDANKERLAGKVFVLAEIEGRKNEAQKIINFLINIFEYNYYGDEKILLRDRMDGFDIQDIFETVLAKVNQGLIGFLEDERIKIDPATTNITLGVIHEDKLYFSNYGKNKAFLIFRHKGDFEILNVESSVTDDDDLIIPHSDKDSDDDGFHEPVGSKIFSSVINGEIPAYSYFLFTNEALPEYLSNHELINIITKLPPMVAAEQMKNFLQNINSFAPFLGIIVKSTIGSRINELSDVYEDQEVVHQLAGENPVNKSISRNAHSSISHLNYTEQRTEQMLAPAGIISVKKVVKKFVSIVSNLKVEIPENRKITKIHDDSESDIVNAVPGSLKETKVPNLARRESFMLKDKLVFRKRSYHFLPKIGNFFLSFGLSIGMIFSPKFWTGVFRGLSDWLKNLSKKDRILVSTLVACFIILVISIIVTANGNKNKAAISKFDETVAMITNNQAQIDLETAVNNNVGAISTLNNSIAMITSSLPQTKEQEVKKETLLNQLLEQSDRLQKITKVSNFQEIVNTGSWNAKAGADNLVFLNGNLYISDGLNKAIYNFNVKNSARNQITLADSVALTSPSVSDSDLYYLAGQKIVKISKQSVSRVDANLTDFQGDNLIQFYNGYLYLLSKADNQIYKYSKDLSSHSDWLKETANLSQTTDFKVDGRITIAQNSGDLIRFNKGKKVDYKTADISPAIRADKVLVTANNIYLLDIKNSRLINLGKDGNLVKQYRLVKDNLKDFAVDESGKAVYILAGTSVYKFGL